MHAHARPLDVREMAHGWIEIRVFDFNGLHGSSPRFAAPVPPALARRRFLLVVSSRAAREIRVAPLRCLSPRRVRIPMHGYADRPRGSRSRLPLPAPVRTSASKNRTSSGAGARIGTAFRDGAAAPPASEIPDY